MAEGPIIRFGKVTEVEDPHGGGRIQARTVYDNTKENDEELNYYIPLLPKMLHVVPKVGELVLLISMAPGKFDYFGYYIGPIISQENKLLYEEADDAVKITETGYIDWGENPRMKKGVLPTLYPEHQDISIEGRKDTGIQLKEEEVRVKAGVKVVGPTGPRNNTTSPSFISLRYYPDYDYGRDGYMSTATIVADKINLFGNASNEMKLQEEISNIAYNGKDELIPEEAMKRLINKAHRVPYGEILLDFLELFRSAFAKHVHPFPTMAPCNDENMKAVTSFNLEGTLSDNVRIN